MRQLLPFTPEPHLDAAFLHAVAFADDDVIAALAEGEAPFEARAREWFTRAIRKRAFKSDRALPSEGLVLYTINDASRRMTLCQHAIRFFAASILLLDSGQLKRHERNFYYTPTLGRMTESALALGREASIACARTVVALAEIIPARPVLEEPPSRSFHALSALLLGAADRTDDELATQCAALEELVEEDTGRFAPLLLSDSGDSTDYMKDDDPASDDAVWLARAMVAEGSLPWLLCLDETCGYRDPFCSPDDFGPWLRTASMALASRRRSSPAANTLLTRLGVPEGNEASS